jgi:hypothetical protein
MAYIQKATLTRFPHDSDRALQEYNQRVYSRDFDSGSVRLDDVDDF